MRMPLSVVAPLRAVSKPVASFPAILTIAAVLTLTACHHSGNSQPATYTVGGSISGLSATGLVLQNAGTSSTVTANATSFQFQVAAGTSYNVTIATQPDGLTCSVSHGSGTNINATVTNVDIVCNAITHTVSGTITGLTTAGLTLTNNGGDDLSISANAGTFGFAIPIADGGGYNVAAFSQPTGLTCTVSSGAGTRVRAAVTSVDITCHTNTLTVGGTISGLTGSGLELQNNAGDNLTVAALASSFQFATPVAYGSQYEATVLTQPGGQTCSLTSSVGNATRTVNTVAVTCTNIITYTLISSSGSNGAISPSGASAVNSGGSHGYAATPDTGYAVNQWLLDSSPVQSGGDVFTLTNVTSDHTISVTFGQATLTPSAGSLALSVNCPTAGGSCIYSNAALSGNPRQLFITNNGSVPARNVSVAPSGFPSGTTLSSPTCSSTLDAGSACMITIAPGEAATSSCTSGIAPSNGTVTVSSDDAPSTVVDVVVLSYGCEYQGGLLYSINDAYVDHPESTSIGGKVAALSDSSLAINWDPTPDCFNSFNCYITNATGGIDGSNQQNPPGNTSLIYQALTTANPPAESPGSYAAGLCTLYAAGGYSDWYLPAISEMGYGTSDPPYFDSGTQSAPSIQNMQSNLADNNIGNLIGGGNFGGYYWSSTEYAHMPRAYAWLHHFVSTGGSVQSYYDKPAQLGVRCSRSLTQ